MIHFPFHRCIAPHSASGAIDDRWSNDGQSLFGVAVKAPPGLAARLLETGIHVLNASALPKDSPLDRAVCYFHAARGESPKMVGLGAAAHYRASSPQAWGEARQALQALSVSVADELRPHIRFFGGGAFDPQGAAASSPWAEFGKATFLLPRVTYVDEGKEAAFILIFNGRDAAATLELAARLTQLRPPSRGPLPSVEVLSKTESANRQQWEKLVGAAQSAMAQGELSKVVTARRLSYRLTGSPPFGDVLGRLEAQSRDCHIFGLYLGRRFFLGATPETLIQKRGGSIETEALAGTRSLESGASLEVEAEALLTSKKDLNEHHFVVEAIQQALEAHCHSLKRSSLPEIRILRRMLHLRSAISATLNEPLQHILDLAKILHPTPAVGGVPQDAALEFLTRHEGLERGWYAAPFGWFNLDGDGHFVVALRSALISDNEVQVYAGAGIVPESDWSAEYQETELKMSSILHALGLGAQGKVPT